MARVKTAVKSARGKPIECGSPRHTEANGFPSRQIVVGETYYWALPGFRTPFSRRKIRCQKHPFRPSELTTSHLSGVYAAQEDATDELSAVGAFEDTETIQNILEPVAEAAEEAKEAYREADEAFGGGGSTENSERADTLETYTDAIRDWEPDHTHPDPCDQHEEEESAFDVIGRQSADGQELCEACEQQIAEWREEVIDSAQQTIDDLGL